MKYGLFFLAAAAALAQGDPALLVSTEWLAGKLNDPSLVLLQIGGEFTEGHIPGARPVLLSDISIAGPGGLRVELPPVPALEQAFSRLGVNEGSRVVIYAGNEAVQSATRLWFTLDYLGWGSRAALLDGGLALWKKEGRPLASGPPKPASGNFKAKSEPDRIATADWLSRRLKDPKVRVLDARTPEFYSGEKGGGMPRAGHIPGAHNVPYTSLFTESGTLKPAQTLGEMLNVPDSATAVSYCHIGLQASVLYFVARRLGLDVRLYDGSFQEWSANRELPVVGPAQ